jgi:transcriptional regulator
VVEVHPGEAIELLGAMTDAYEGNRPNGWSIGELDARVRESLPKGVVALRMQITRIEGKAKLSQNKPRLERERVISELKAAGEDRIAALMQTELDRV